MSRTKTSTRTRGAFGPRNAEHKHAIAERHRKQLARVKFIWNRENAPTAV